MLEIFLLFLKSRHHLAVWFSAVLVWLGHSSEEKYLRRDAGSRTPKNVTLSVKEVRPALANDTPFPPLYLKHIGENYILPALWPASNYHTGG